MEFDKQMYGNVGDYHAIKDRNYEIVNVSTREVENEYDQMELKVPHKNSLIASDKSTADGGIDVNKSGKTTKRQCVAVILIFAFLLITVVAIALSVANYVTIHSIKGQIKLNENASREHISAIQTLMQVTHNLNAQFNATQEGITQLQNNTSSFVSQQFTTLTDRLNETKSSTDELKNDFILLKSQFNDFSSTTNEAITRAACKHA